MSFAEVFASFGISFGEYLVLAALRRAGPPYQMNPTRLFNSVILSSGAMTKRVDRLEEMGLVERRPDPTDRRGRLVALTDHGRELVDTAVVKHLENEQRTPRGSGHPRARAAPRSAAQASPIAAFSGARPCASLAGSRRDLTEPTSAMRSGTCTSL